MTPTYDVIISSYTEDVEIVADTVKKLHPQSRTFVMDNGLRYDYFNDPDGQYRYVMPENLGFVKATNAGIAMSTAPYLVLLNDDTMVFNNVLDRMREHMERDPKVGIVGAVSSPGFSWVCINNRREVYDEYSNINADTPLTMEDHGRISNEIATRHGGTSIEAGMVPFFCVMIKREVIEKVGYLSEEYGVGLGDDDDYCERVRRAGYKVLLALDCYVYHKQRTTFKELYTPEQIKEIQDKNIDYFKTKWGVQ